MPLAQPGLKILALSPHTDDAELGAGATIARLVDEGAIIHVIAFSTGNKDTGAHYHEFEQACSELGVAYGEALGFGARRFNDFRQDILQWMWDAYGSWEPQVVMCPPLEDRHQDHVVVAQEAVRAFKYATILAYEEPTSVGAVCYCPDWWFRVDESHMQRKLLAIDRYVSQKERVGMDADTIMATATMRGAQCGARYAEAFQLIRHVE